MGVGATLYIRWRNSLSTASAAFRSTFSNAISELRNGADDPFLVLSAAYSVHETAVLEFARHLGRFKRKRFLEAWRKYHCHEDTNIDLLEQYGDGGASLSERHHRRELAIQRIEHLLAYAKHT